jgi:hypothetical protein
LRSSSNFLISRLSVSWAMKVTHHGQADHDEHSFKIGHHIFGRVFAELLSLEWFLNEMMNTSHFAPSYLFDADKT